MPDTDTLRAEVVALLRDLVPGMSITAERFVDALVALVLAEMGEERS